ncbi:hypothetical protein I312_105550 [Cryptococcus bacillisporus CA1280]|uniref:Translation machinery-associated protein 16 n=2 Tax=Cryptococcus gattii TaxID=552467 RepID=A0A0D0VCE7_CRYGA|nr:translation machinery-associated protein 16 [Cryptococcus bacillisporus CA1280]KIR44493.1 translation machinery-associated protein 16 [Cryptococcus bacillisporus CA1280]KIR60280.1 translation machinery-associated protein 16 [Cryptococcus bacillisporus CA1873]|eukprot:KIR60280.1 translation machinery-associated protein 16 [Cryptococcus gattii CA1873]
MPNNRKITKKTIKGKEGLHPGSRKAAQLTRVQLRVEKLKGNNKARKDHVAARVQRPLFFIHSLSSPNPLTLSSLKALITEVYLKRHDPRIEELTRERRPGRPKPKELLDLEEVKRRETGEYETGMEVPDLTHPPTTLLIHSWLSAPNPPSIDHSHIDLLRHIRVSPNGDVLLTKEGRTGEMGLGNWKGEGEGDDWTSFLEGVNANERQGQEMEE